MGAQYINVTPIVIFSPKLCIFGQFSDENLWTGVTATMTSLSIEKNRNIVVFKTGFINAFTFDVQQKWRHAAIIDIMLAANATTSNKFVTDGTKNAGKPWKTMRPNSLQHDVAKKPGRSQQNK